MRRFDPPDVGVVGPTCNEGNTAILTHDFVHVRHVSIFGTHYPRALTDWWLDDWITTVYGPERTRKLPNVRVIHHLTQTHYEVTWSNANLLSSELQVGKDAVRKYIAALVPNVMRAESQVTTKSGRRVEISDMPSPLFVVFSNTAFEPILRNMLCHSRRMTPFLNHLLVVSSNPDLQLPGGFEVSSH